MATAAEDDLNKTVRRADPDRWLATRFISDPHAQADVLALYAFDAELSRANRVASNALIAEMRMVWWRDVVEEIYGGGLVKAHPVATALATAVRRRNLAREPLDEMIERRIEVLDVAFLTIEEAVRWADGVAGSAAWLAARVLDPGASPASSIPAGRIWGLHLLAGDRRADRTQVLNRLRAERPLARQAARRLSVAAFPAVAHAALATAASADEAMSPIEKRLRLLWAVETGRI